MQHEEDHKREEFEALGLFWGLVLIMITVIFCLFLQVAIVAVAVYELSLMATGWIRSKWHRLVN